MINRRAMLGLAIPALALCATCDPAEMLRRLPPAVDIPPAAQTQIHFETWQYIGRALHQAKSGPNFRGH